MTPTSNRRWLRFSLPIVFVLVAICLGGCPNSGNHARQIGHTDVTFDVSPTSDVIVFNAEGAGGRDLYFLRLSDLSVSRVAETPEYETWPSFSADGKYLVYAAGVTGDRADHLFVRPVAGGRSQQLTRVDRNDLSPKFSPDGKLVVFARNPTYNWGGLAANWQGSVICTVQSDGANERQITADGQFAGTKIFCRRALRNVFHAERTKCRFHPRCRDAETKPTSLRRGTVARFNVGRLCQGKVRTRLQNLCCQLGWLFGTVADTGHRKL